MRAMNTRKAIKLNLSGLLQKDTPALDFILQGLKQNEHCCEINLSSNQLDDQDLAKICDVLEGDSKVTKLLLAQNQFTDCTPLIELMKHNGRFLQYLDISQCLMNDEALR